MFEQLDIEVVAETSANFDAAKQKADVETVAAKKPSVLLTLPVDAVVTASAYQAIAQQGTKIVLLSIIPQGMEYGRDYVNVVTDDLFQMGKRAADALAAAVGDKGTAAYLFHDANHYVTNQRDQAFLKTITLNYPNIDVVAKHGIADPNKAQDEANAVLLDHPDLSGVYVTFSQPPAEGVLASLRSNGNTTTKIVSLDLDDVLALDMAKGGSDVRPHRGQGLRTRPGDGNVRGIRAARQAGPAVRHRSGHDDHEVEPRSGLPGIAPPEPAGERDARPRQVGRLARPETARKLKSLGAAEPRRYVVYLAFGADLRLLRRHAAG